MTEPPQTIAILALLATTTITLITQRHQRKTTQHQLKINELTNELHTKQIRNLHNNINKLKTNNQ